MADAARQQGAGGRGARTGPRRSELLAALSLAIDLGLGQPMEHMLRSCVLGLRLSDELGLERERRSRVFYATLLSWIGCHAESHELAGLFGDDIGFRSGAYRVDKHGLPLARYLLSRVAGDDPALVRAGRVMAFLATGRTAMTRVIGSHCVSAGTLAREVGISDDVAAMLGFAFERWDGAGLPRGARREEIPLEMRVVHLVDTAEVYLRERGPAAAVSMARARSGTHFDPEVVDVFCARAPELIDGLFEDDAWRSTVESAPDDALLSGAELDVVLAATGEFVDLKSPFTAGHSRGVAALAEAAARHHGLDPHVQQQLRRAGYAHDLGRMGVSNAVWDKRTPLTAAEQERVRLHPYLSERILRRVPGLETIAALAGAHHERLDGSGYPQGTGAEAQADAARILAAADSYQTSIEPRPHRPALEFDEAASRMRAHAADQRLDASAVEAVLAAAGHRPRRRRTWPAGLTNREVEVLRRAVNGMSSREIAADLVISEKTARNHLEHIYAKVGVSNRVGATLFAVRHGLVGGPDHLRPG